MSGFALNKSYTKYAPQWGKCRITSEGEDAVKEAGTEFLPPLEGKKNSTQKSAHYEDYLKRASFYGAMGRTVLGLTGSVMRKPPQIQGSPFTEHKEAMTLLPVGYAGESLIAMIRETVKDSLEVGRSGYLIDAVDPKDLPAGAQNLPYVVKYMAEDILNWHESATRGRKQIVLVVLSEIVQEPSRDPKKGLEIEETQQYRILRLVDDVPSNADASLFRAGDFDGGHVYVQEVWKEVENPDTKQLQLLMIEQVVPRSIKGTPFSYIPFVFINWSDIRPGVSKPPLVDLANVNLSHYRNSADLEHGRHYVALPTPWVAGFNLQGEELEIGSRIAWSAEDSAANAQMLEFSGAGLGHLQTGMQVKEQQMAVLGARLLEETKSGVEQPEAIRLRQSGDKSVLASIVATVGEGWALLLNWMWEWARVEELTEPITITMNTDFSAVQMTPQMLSSLTQTLQSGSLSWITYVEQLQRGEIIDSNITPEEEAERIAAGLPSASLNSASNDQQFPEDDDEDDEGNTGHDDDGDEGNTGHDDGDGNTHHETRRKFPKKEA